MGSNVSHLVGIAGAPLQRRQLQQGVKPSLWGMVRPSINSVHKVDPQELLVRESKGAQIFRANLFRFLPKSTSNLRQSQQNYETTTQRQQQTPTICARPFRQHTQLCS
eukprot:6396215-Amphidinium_carterae.1